MLTGLAVTFARSNCASSTAKSSSRASVLAVLRFLIDVNIQKFSARFVEPMLSLAVATLPEGPEWLYEVKFDGYRALGLKTDGRAQSSRVMAETSRRGSRPLREHSKHSRMRHSVRMAH